MDDSVFQALVRERSRAWQHMSPGCTADDLATLKQQSGLALPDAYLALLAWSDGPEGSLGALPEWFQLWPAAEVLRLNREYQLARWVPGFFGIGSSGGGELLAFDTRVSAPWPVCAIPFIPLDEAEAIVVAADLLVFLALTGEEWPSDTPAV